METNSSVINKTAENVTKLRHLESQEARDKNLVLFGIKDCSTKQETAEQIQNVFKECHLSQIVNEKNMCRPGKKNTCSDASDSKPMHIKLCTQFKDEKWEIIKRINGLKKGDIFAKLDLTKAERLEDFQLYQTLKKKREENPSIQYKMIQKKVVELTKHT